MDRIILPTPVKLEHYERALTLCPQKAGENFHDWMVRVSERAVELQAKEQRARLPYREDIE